MLKLFIVLFRETLEISLIISLILVATHNIQHRLKYIITGIILGLFLVICTSLSIHRISNAFNGFGQEIIMATLLFVAAFLISLTVIFLKRHTRNITSKIKQQATNIKTGESSLIYLSIITAITIFREGTEIFLFSYGIILSTPKEELFSPLLAGILGIASAIALGAALFMGIFATASRHFLRISTFLLSLIAASMSAQAIKLLGSTGIIEESPLWNSSNFIAEDSILGVILHDLIGYTSKPSLSELLAYLITLTFIVLGLRLTNK